MPSVVATTPRRRVHEARTAHQLAARGDREPPVRRPPQVRGERSPVRRHPGRVPAAGARRSRRGLERRQTPRSSRVTRSTRCSISATPSGARIAPRITAASSATVVAQPRAGSTARRRERVPSSSPTSTTPRDGSRRERLGREGDLPRSPSDDTDREALPRERACRVEHRVEPVPRDAGLRRARRRPACGRPVGPTAGLPRRTRAGPRRPAGPAAPPRPRAGSHARIGSPPREGPPPAGQDRAGGGRGDQCRDDRLPGTYLDRLRARGRDRVVHFGSTTGPSGPLHIRAV